MTESMKELLKLASSNSKLLESLKTADKDGLIALAKEQGIELTEADFVPNKEMSEEELEVVSGGGVCACVPAGGGTAKGEYDDACGCYLLGGGEGIGRYGDRYARCWCFYGGGGEEASGPTKKNNDW